jgi:Holliday junction resolvase RusA-like endonuclease
VASITIEAYGKPEPQGSARAYVRGGKAIVTSANSELRPWRDTVAAAARDALGEHPGWVRTSAPIFLTVSFWMPRPKSAPKTRDILPVRGVDLDKLIRAVGDSLTNAGVWVDDSQVVDIRALERYVVGPDLPKIYIPGWHRTAPGVTIHVEEIG